MSCGVGCRRGLDLALLWLWWRPVAAAPIRSLAWETPCVAGAALKRQKKKNCYITYASIAKCLPMSMTSKIKSYFNQRKPPITKKAIQE